jgi:hypothetical protein
MHSFSPLRFDLAKQRCRKRHGHMPQYQSAPLRKTCTRLESLPCRTVWRFGARLYTDAAGRFGTSPMLKPAKRPVFNAVIFGAAVAL